MTPPHSTVTDCGPHPPCPHGKALCPLTALDGGGPGSSPSRVPLPFSSRAWSLGLFWSSPGMGLSSRSPGRTHITQPHSMHVLKLRVHFHLKQILSYVFRLGFCFSCNFIDVHTHIKRQYTVLGMESSQHGDSAGPAWLHGESTPGSLRLSAHPHRAPLAPAHVALCPVTAVSLRHEHNHTQHPVRPASESQNWRWPWGRPAHCSYFPFFMVSWNCILLVLPTCGY